MKFDMKFMKKWILIIGGGLIGLVALSIGVAHVAAAAPDITLIEVTGRSDIDFRVYYIDNELFTENPVAKNLHFLRHLTDFIEVENSMVVNFSDEFEIIYTYTAEKRFEISYGGTQTGANPVIFQIVTEIDRTRSMAQTNRLVFEGGTYQIFLNEYHDIFNHFVEYNEMRLGTIQLRGFSAELVVEFTYTIVAPEVGIRETIQRGFTIPIDVNVFSPQVFGPTGFTASSVAEEDLPEVSVLLMGGLGMAAAAGGLGILLGAKKMPHRATDPHRVEYDDIMKKYRNEIIMTTGTADLSKFVVQPVSSFDELLKISLNLGKLIVCHNEGDRAVFYAIVDAHAFNYEIRFFMRKLSELREGKGAKI